MSARYSVGDKFIVDGIESIVLFINKGFAWIGPTKDSVHKGLSFRKGLCFTKLDKFYRTPEGKIAISMNSYDCGAI